MIKINLIIVLFKMIDKTPLPGLNINSNEAKTHINNFWSYLDDLAENNPEEYKKFIESQMKKNISMQNEASSQLKPKELEVQACICLRFKPVKLIKDLETDNDKDLNDPDVRIHESSDIKEVPQIKFSPDFQSDAFTSKVIQNRKIYLNVLKAKDYFTPTDEKGNFLSKEAMQDVNNWRYIPTEFRYNGKKMSMSNTRCDFYDAILNIGVIDKMKTGKELYKSILGYICRKFAIFLNDKAELYMKSVKIVQGKTYKSLKPKPELFLVKAANVSHPQHRQALVMQDSMMKRQSKPKEEDKEIIIPGLSRSFPPQSKQSDMPKDNAKKEEKKVLIQEIESKSSSKQSIPLTKKVISPTQMEVRFDFEEFEHLNGINEIDLQISENGIILHLDNPKYITDENYEPIKMAFDSKIDPDQCKAKYNKKGKVLTITLVRIV